MTAALPCPRCRGRGRLPNSAIVGAYMRSARRDAALSLREVARRLGYSPSYLSLLERGLRPWRNDLLMRYRAAIRL